MDVQYIELDIYLLTCLPHEYQTRMVAVMVIHGAKSFMPYSIRSYKLLAHHLVMKSTNNTVVYIKRYVSLLLLLLIYLYSNRSIKKFYAVPYLSEKVYVFLLILHKSVIHI